MRRLQRPLGWYLILLQGGATDMGCCVRYHTVASRKDLRRYNMLYDKMEPAANHVFDKRRQNLNHLAGQAVSNAEVSIKREWHTT